MTPGALFAYLGGSAHGVGVGRLADLQSIAQAIAPDHIFRQA